MTTIGMLGGTGPEGRGLGLRLARAGYQVVLGSRDTGRATQIASELRGGEDLAIEGGANADAAERAETVVNVLPYAGQAATLRPLAGALAGKLVVSTVNPIAFDDRGPHAVAVPEGSAAQQAQAIASGARVTAAFHHLSAPILLGKAPEVVADVLVCGDEPGAVEETMALVEAIRSLRAVNAGALRLAAQLESLTAVIVSVNQRYKVRAGVQLTGL